MAASERGRKLYIGGLLDTVHKEDLAKEFKKYGEVSDVWVARNPPGFAFVEFTTAVNAEKAVRALDGMNVCGSRIRVEFANSSNGKGGERRAMMKSNNRAYSGSQNNRGASRSRSPPNRDRRNSDSPAQYGNSHRRGRSPFSSSSRLLGLDPISAAAAALFGAAGHPGQATGIPYGLAGLLPVMPPNELLRSIRRRKPSPNRHSSPSNRRRPRSRSPIYSRNNGRNSNRSPPRSNGRNNRFNRNRRSSPTPVNNRNDSHSKTRRRSRDNDARTSRR